MDEPAHTEEGQEEACNLNAVFLFFPSASSFLLSRVSRNPCLFFLVISFTLSSLAPTCCLLRPLTLSLSEFAKENPCDLSMLPRVSIGENETPSVEAVTVTLRRAVKFFSSIQAHDGHWPGDFGGPLFYISGLVITLYVTGALHNVLSLAHIQEMRHYLYNHQNEDGGWGLHVESPSTMFGTALNYVVLRLFGEKPEGTESSPLEKARKWILDRGGVTAIPSWGKIWLSVLGVYDWSGINPVPPEMWLLPYFLPFHPGRFWCHCRMVYSPMSYLYGKRFVGHITETVLHLRKELLPLPYDRVDWNKARNLCAKLINPSEMFGRIMIDHPTTECTSSAIQALADFRKAYPQYRKEDIETSISEAVKFIKKVQLPDGSWYGTWGICFTYATWFGIEALVAGGMTYQDCSAIRKACEFLLSKQLESGGWGESYLSCLNKVYTNLKGQQSHLVNTAWAMLALLSAGQAERDPKPLHHAARVLINGQMDNGDFPQQEIMGAALNTLLLAYSAYRNIFPIWALGKYRSCMLLSS